ncbi:hypothetical protein ACFST9_15390 [Hymenobacter monticola]|uniref:Uncharacterized protein n=1 Tax=Hymenobacter monticola TaxID=1705399 RepID=A0ABY4B0M3_9BACT|nr:hypothetical protein [Hymenobacter monticola]UOE32703.1 hypothetical protein MTP16_16390 [Hymenobacter monticola]
MSDRPKYRFTNSKGCLLQESGFFKREGEYCKDTLDRLTIETSLGFDDEMTLANLDGTIHYWEEHTKVIGGNPPIWKAKRLQVINGRTFGILESFGPGKLIDKPYEQLSAKVKFRQGGKPWEVVFNFECKQRNCRDFVENANKILRSVRIDTVANTTDK